MSDLIGFHYADSDSTPELAKLLDAHISETYDDDNLVAGHLAFDDDYNVIDARVYLYGQLGDGTPPLTAVYGEGEGAYENFLARLTDLGSTITATFVRRPKDQPMPPRPSVADAKMFDIVNFEASLGTFTYVGHIMTDGTRHAILEGGAGDAVNGMSGMLARMLGQMDNAAKAALSHELRDQLTDHPDIPPESADAIGAALDVVIEAYETDTPVSTEQKDVVDKALRAIERDLAARGARPATRQRKNPLELPPPGVPRAFYEN